MYLNSFRKKLQGITFIKRNYKKKRKITNESFHFNKKPNKYQYNNKSRKRKTIMANKKVILRRVIKFKTNNKRKTK